MGRKPKNEYAMTDAEKMREYRQRKKKQGNKEINITLPEDALQQIDALVEFFELPNRAILLKELLKAPLITAIDSMSKFQENKLNQLGNGDLPKGAEDILIATKNALWSSIVNGVSDEMNDTIRELQNKLNNEEQMEQK